MKNLVSLTLLLVLLLWTGWHTARLTGRSDWDAAAGMALVMFALATAFCSGLGYHRPRLAIRLFLLCLVVAVGALCLMLIEALVYGFDLEAAAVAGALVDVVLAGAYRLRHEVLVARVGDEYARRSWKKSFLELEQRALRQRALRLLAAFCAPAVGVGAFFAMLHGDALAVIVEAVLGVGLTGMIIADETLVRLSKISRQLAQ